MEELERIDPQTALDIAESFGDFDIEDHADDDEDAQYMLEELFDALDDHAPPFCYFGANVGDGSDFGFWVAWECVEEAIHDDEIAKIDDASELDTLVAHDYALHVNDHGDATLYVRDGIDWREAWSIV